MQLRLLSLFLGFATFAWGIPAYMCYPCSRHNINLFVPTLGYIAAKKLTELTADHVAMTDLIYGWDSTPHRSGSTPKALNILWGDGHVKASKSPQAFSNPALWGNNPTAINGGGPAPDAADRPNQFQKLFPAFNHELQVAHRAGDGVPNLKIHAPHRWIM